MTSKERLLIHHSTQAQNPATKVFTAKVKGSGALEKLWARGRHPRRHAINLLLSCTVRRHVQAVGQQAQQAPMLLQLSLQTRHLPGQGLLPLITTSARGAGSLLAIAVAGIVLGAFIEFVVPIALLSLVINCVIPSSNVAGVALLERRAAGLLQQAGLTK